MESIITTPKIAFDQNGLATDSGLIDAFHTDQDDIYIGEQPTQVIKGFGLPVGVYLDAPNVIPEKNTTIIRKNNHWQLIPDFRGQTVYKKSTGETVEIKETGALPDDLTEKEYPGEFYEWDGGSWTENQAKKDAATQAINETQKSALLAYAKEQIDILQDELDLGLSENETATAKQLKTWKAYRVKLNKVALIQPAWPKYPKL